MWDAGSVPAGGMMVGAMVYYPKGVTGPLSPVAVVHGAGLSAAAYVDLGRGLASHGLVAAVLSFPDLLLNPTMAHGAAVNAVLDWVAMQAAGGMAPLPMLKNDARGIAGHSNGGRTTYYAATQSNLYKAIVSLDAFGDLSGGGGFTAPSMHLIAETNGCSAGDSGYTVSPAPKLLATVTGGSHCDVNDAAVAGACGFVCTGAPYNAAAHDIFRRYTVAFLVCLLGSEGSMMQPYVGGASWQADVTANKIHSVQESGGAAILCKSDAMLPMAGMGAAGMGVGGMGAGGPPEDICGDNPVCEDPLTGGIGGGAPAAGGTPVAPTAGAGATGGMGAIAGADGTAPGIAGMTAMGGDDGGGCSAVPSHRASDASAALCIALVALGLALRRRASLRAP